ncbi:hypothetical protein NPIL_23261 [Nephila pilipes]|uniref:Uncharacterized protein n=1 Tax=Nephila pilipes TaxID=299642 RepID=A0A8X6IM72_NEPPI|nr:hypothetical protein NPIL_23261 [Nephila pilipes]
MMEKNIFGENNANKYKKVPQLYCTSDSNREYETTIKSHPNDSNIRVSTGNIPLRLWLFRRQQPLANSDIHIHSLPLRLLGINLDQCAWSHQRAQPMHELHQHFNLNQLCDNVIYNACTFKPKVGNLCLNKHPTLQQGHDCGFKYPKHVSAVDMRILGEYKHPKAQTQLRETGKGYIDSSDPLFNVAGCSNRYLRVMKAMEISIHY